MQLLGLLQTPGAGDRAVVAAIVAALIVLAAVPVRSEAIAPLEAASRACSLR